MSLSLEEALKHPRPLAQISDDELARMVYELLWSREIQIPCDRITSNWKHADELILQALLRISAMNRPEVFQTKVPWNNPEKMGASPRCDTIAELVLTSMLLDFRYIRQVTRFISTDLSLPCSLDPEVPLCVAAIHCVMNTPTVRNYSADSMFNVVAMHPSVDIVSLVDYINPFLELGMSLGRHLARTNVLQKLARSGHLDLLTPSVVRNLVAVGKCPATFSYIIETVSARFIAENNLVQHMTSAASRLLEKPCVPGDVPYLDVKLRGAMRHRLLSLCIGLAASDLPVLLSVEILAQTEDYFDGFTMHNAWQVAKLVKDSAVPNSSSDEQL